MKINFLKFDKQKLKPDLLFIVAFFVLTIFFTFPVITDLDGRLTDNGDPYFVSWVIQDGTDAIKNLDIDSFWNSDIFYPYPNTKAFSDHSLTLSLQYLPLSYFSDDATVIINYTQLLGFFLSAVFSFLLFRFYFKKNLPAFIAACVFAFSSYHILRMNHLQIMSYQYLPLLIYFLEKYFKKPNTKDLSFFCLSFLLNAFVSVYLLSFSIVAVITVVLFRFRKSNFKKYLHPNLLIGILSAVTLLFFYYPYLNVSEYHNIEYSEDQVKMNTPLLGNYLNGPETNLLVGERSADKKIEFPDVPWADRAVYLGIFTLIIATLGFFLNKFKKKIDLRTYGIYITFGVVGFLISLGYYIEIFGANIPMPLSFLKDIIPTFKAVRAPGRAHIITLLGISFFIGLFFLNFGKLKLQPKVKYLFLFIIIGVLLFEHINIPLFRKNASFPLKDTFIWLEQNIPEDKVIAHYPFFLDHVYVRGNMVDNHKILNGYSGFYPSSTQRFMRLSRTEDFYNNPEKYLSILATIGVDYFVLNTSLHTDFIPQQDNIKLLNTLRQNSNLDVVANIDGSYVYYIEDLYDESFLKTQTKISIDKISNNEYTITHSNPSDVPWVNDELGFYEIHDTNGKIKEIKIYKPLYLLPGETISEIVTLKRDLTAQDIEIK